jgi:hypothetical protein
MPGERVHLVAFGILVPVQQVMWRCSPVRGGGGGRRGTAMLPPSLGQNLTKFKKWFLVTEKLCAFRPEHTAS